MTFEDYKDWVQTRVNTEKSTLSGAHSTEINTALAAFGIAGEAGEVVDVLKKSMFHGRGYSIEQVKKLREEMGDLLWYFALLCKLFGFTLEEIIRTNQTKLLIRDGQHNENFHKARA